tara:strand:- start:303 stop:545 length:243 start_codon:yes stop_codon:yes gene_type:complete
MTPAPAISKLAPSIVSAASVWRIAHRPLSRWAKRATRGGVRLLSRAAKGPTKPHEQCAATAEDTAEVEAEAAEAPVTAMA